ncbi:MAG: hypothetical protein ABR875_02395 [Minisyncoccia bacterium]
MINEFRQDLVSGEWVLFATGRAKRPGEPTANGNGIRIGKNFEDCPFDDPEAKGNEVLMTYKNADGSDWFAKIIKNKFPAVSEGEMAPRQKVGPFEVTDAKGLHEILIFKDHNKSPYHLSPKEFSEIIRIYRDRYLTLAGYSGSKYILIFHNHGLAAGASIPHPHSQIITIPILPPDIKRSILGSERFYRENGKRVYDLMLDWEMNDKKRIVAENDDFVAFCPFVSKTPYEVRIFGKESHAHFERIPDPKLQTLGEIMSKVMRKVSKALNAPDFNYFIHTAPTDGMSQDVHDFYAWHIEILPKMKIEGAFELGSGVEVNVVDPDEAAKLLREAEVEN